MNKKSEIIKRIEEINNLIKENKLEEADEKIDDIFSKIEIVEVNNHGRVYDFSNELEFIFFCQTLEKRVNISWTRNFASELYYLKSAILFRKEEYKEAVKIVNHAMKWNPVNGKLYLALLDNYIKLDDGQAFEKVFNKAKSMMLEPADLSLLYNKYAAFCMENKRHELAYNVFRYAFLLSPKKENEIAIDNISKIIGIKLRNIPDVGVIQYIRDEGLEYEPDKNVVLTYITAAKNLERVLKKETNQEKKLYLYAKLVRYYNNLYVLKTDKDIHNLLMSTIKDYINFKQEIKPKNKG